MQFTTWNCHILCMVMMAGGCLMSRSAVAGDTTDFSWTMTSATCDVTTTPVGALDLGFIDPNPLVSGVSWTRSADRSLTVDLTCTGTAGTGVRPSVKVSGTSMASASGDTGTPFNYLFKDSGTSVGYGVILRKLNAAGGSNTDDIKVKNGEFLFVPKDASGNTWYGTGETLPATVSIPLTAAVACGEASVAWCQSTGMSPGTLLAAINFEFAYR